MKTADWLDNLPKGWRGLRLKRVASLSGQREVEPAPDEYYVGMENIESWTGRLRESNALAADLDEEPESKSTSNRFSPDDILFGKLRPYLAKVWLANRTGICSTELLVLQGGEKVHAPFLAHVLRTREFIDAVDGTTFGSRMPRADWTSIGDIPVPLPPIEQQRAIADHLDRETRRMDELIAAKLRWLEVLAEKRAVTISKGVTRGLEVDTLHHGLSWADEIPSHWQVIRLRWLLDKIEQGWSPQAEAMTADDDAWGVIKLSAIKSGKFIAQEHKALPLEYEIPTNLEVRPGDFLLTRANTPTLVGDVCVVKETRSRLIFSDLVFRLRLRPDRIHPEFLCFFLSTIGRAQIEGDARGSNQSMVKLSQESIPDWIIPLPPLAEQRAIVVHIQAEMAKIDALKTTTERSLALLRERRAALIAEAVTGRLSI